MTVGGIGGGTLVLFLVAAFLRRKPTGEAAEWKGGTQLTDEEIQEELERLKAEADTNDSGASEIISPPAANLEGTSQPIVPVSDDDIDPEYDQELREEVDVYIAYERFDQAEELVNSAIEKYPLHHEYRLLLLEIHKEAKDVGKFEAQAKRLQKDVNGQIGRAHV